MWGDGSKRPSKRLSDLLTGRVSIQDADPQILQWAEFMIHKAAVEVCKMDSKESRKTALTKFPDTIKPFVEREVKRLWHKRGEIK